MAYGEWTEHENEWRYEPEAGEIIGSTAETMCERAAATGKKVTAAFNDIELVAEPGASATAVATFYATTSKRLHDEYVASPQYKQEQAEAANHDKAKELGLKAALVTAPATLTLRDPVSWQQSVEANQDGYGNAVIVYADLWARLMEAKVSGGAKVADIADECSHIADVEGITGFMYGCAVSILAKVWIHGEELRRWHNLDAQIGTEGERANENGGVLNPAVLVVGDK